MSQHQQCIQMQHITSPHIKEDFLSKEECAILVHLVQAYARQERGCKATCCAEKRTEVAARNVFAHGFSKEAALLAEIRKRCCVEVDQGLRPGRQIFPTFMILAGNYPGDGHVRHADNCRYDANAGVWVPNHTPDRVATCGIYLNECGADFAGGELVFPGLQKTVRPAPGLLVAFPSDERFEHEVPVVTRGSRYSIFLWFSANRQLAEHPLLPSTEVRLPSRGGA